MGRFPLQALGKTFTAGSVLLLLLVLLLPATTHASTTPDPEDKGRVCDDKSQINHAECPNPDGSVTTCNLVTRPDQTGWVCTTHATDGSTQTSIKAPEVDTTGNTDAAGNTTVTTGDPAAKAVAGVAGAAGKGALNLILDAVAGIAFIFFWLAANMVTLASILFNFSINVLVFGFAKYFGNSTGLLLGWSILRDFGNIILLFGFVWIGIQTILNTSHSSVGKTLPRLVIFAVLLNFSLFAAEAVIDTSNAFSSVIYSQAYGTDCPAGSAQDCPYKKGIGSTVLSMAGMGSIVQEATALKGIGDGDNLQRIIGFVIMTILLTIVAFVLLAGAILLITRGITLVLLMVTSPIGFAGMAIPELNGMANTWWKTLVNNAIFAPVYLLLIFVSIQIMQTLNSASIPGISGTPNLVKVAMAFSTTDIGGLMIFLLIIGFLVAATMVAKQLGIMGADFATQTAGALTYGTMGAITRRTVGRSAYNLGQGLRSTQFARSGMGRLVVGGLDSVGKNSFDVRNSKVASSLLTGAAISKKGAVNLGKGQHGGYTHIAHEGAKKLVEYGRTLKSTREEKEEEARRKKMLEDGQKATATQARNSKTAGENELRELEEGNKAQADTRRQKKTLLETAARTATESVTKGRSGLENAKTDAAHDIAARSQDVDTARASIAAADAAIAAAQGSGDAEAFNAATKSQKAATEALKEAVNALSNAHITGSREVSRNEEKVRNAEATLANAMFALTDHKEFDTKESKKETQAVEQLRGKLRKEQESFAAAMESYRNSINENAKKFKNVAQKQYAEYLHHEGARPGPLWFTAAGPFKGEAYMHAAHDLETWAGKSDTEKALEKLNDTLKNSGQETVKELKKEHEAANEDAANDNHGGSHSGGEKAHH